jgi:alanine-glyoxylate transaminase / (R)-3-amino-2-methylpropionate-pyruvate transaminase
VKKNLPVLPHFDYTPVKYSGPSYEQIKAMRKQHVHPASMSFYREPVLAVEGKMQYIYDHTGKRYLDFICGVNTVGLGHCHPRITAAM